MPAIDASFLHCSYHMQTHTHRHIYHDTHTHTHTQRHTWSVHLLTVSQTVVCQKCEIHKIHNIQLLSWNSLSNYQNPLPKKQNLWNPPTRVTTLLGKSFFMTFQDQPKQISMTYRHYANIYPILPITHWHYTVTADIHYRLSQCSCKNFTTLSVNFPWPLHGFSMTFQDFLWPMLFSMTTQAWNLVFLNPMTFQAQWSPWPTYN